VVINCVPAMSESTVICGYGGYDRLRAVIISQGFRDKSILASVIPDIEFSVHPVSGHLTTTTCLVLPSPPMPLSPKIQHLLSFLPTSSKCKGMPQGAERGQMHNSVSIYGSQLCTSLVLYTSGHT
jgi:hypothetical protein